MLSLYSHFAMSTICLCRPMHFHGALRTFISHFCMSLSVTWQKSSQSRVILNIKNSNLELPLAIATGSPTSNLTIPEAYFSILSIIYWCFKYVFLYSRHGHFMIYHHFWLKLGTFSQIRFFQKKNLFFIFFKFLMQFLRGILLHS